MALNFYMSKTKKRETPCGCLSHYIFVRMTGLEPTRLSTPDPKSGAATNYATSALVMQR